MDLARPNPDSARMVASVLQSELSLNRTEAYRLRERVRAIEAAAQLRATNPRIQAMDDERQRLDAIPFSQMEIGACRAEIERGDVQDRGITQWRASPVLGCSREVKILKVTDKLRRWIRMHSCYILRPLCRMFAVAVGEWPI